MFYIFVSSGVHRRLGAAGNIRQLDAELCRMIADMASKYTVSKLTQTPGDFSSVAAAVTAVPDGATIYLHPGIYDEPPIIVTGRFAT